MLTELKPSSNWRCRKKVYSKDNTISDNNNDNNKTNVETKKQGHKNKKKRLTNASNCVNQSNDMFRKVMVGDPSQLPEINIINQEHKFTCDYLLRFSDRQLFLLTQGVSTWKDDVSVDSNQHRYLAIDGEFVGVGPNGNTSALARISVVDYYGNIVLDKFVRPNKYVTDWRTPVSGITSKDLRSAIPFDRCREILLDLFTGKVIVGHALSNDFEVANITHPERDTRDTQKHAPFKDLMGSKSPSLRLLTKIVLGITIQEGAHSSVVDAQAAMLLFRLNRRQIEKKTLSKRNKRGKIF